MNHIFQPFLRRFVIVIFDDILVYSPTLEAHLDHLAQYFNIVEAHQLFLKKHNYFKTSTRVEYVSHFISHGEVYTDPSKIQYVKDWPIPKDLKQLRVFLGLAGYYRRFLRGFGKIS